MQIQDIVTAWDQASPQAIHPLRRISEDAYWASGEAQAEMLATVIPTRGRVVDFGCGDGRVTKPLRELGYNVIAVDSSGAMLTDVPEPTLQSDGSNLVEQLGRGVSAIYSLAVLIHHDYAGQREIIANLAKATRKGGLLILDWPTSKNPYERKGWIEVTTISEADRAATANDLGLIRQESNLPWPVFKRG